MPQVTQLTAGGKPAAYLLIDDKIEDFTPPDRGGTRITRTYTTGPAPYRTIANKTPSMAVGTARPGDQITKLRGAGLPSAYFTITDKTESLDFFYPVTDTYLVYMSLGPLSDDITVLTTDTYRPVLVLSGSAVIAVPLADTYRPVLTLATSSVTRTGSTPVYGADSYRPVLALSVASLVAGEFIEGSDTYIPVMTFSAAGVVSTDIVLATDTYVPVLQFGFTVTVHSQRSVPVSDDYAVNLTLGASVNSILADVDRIRITSRPYGQIKVKPR
jgi:hypothetical protein